MAASPPPGEVREGAASGGQPDRLAGRVLGGRYKVLSRLGEGGMGTVYLCEHEILKRRFALKVLRGDLAADPELVERFRNEAIAASRIGQENVVEVVDFGSDPDGALYYVMEALEGRNLGTILRDEGALHVPRALALLEQICRALGAAHARGVVHRDVKPENVFVVQREDGSEWAKILDFGISHVPAAPGRDRLTRAGAIIGTPEYMAPEQATGGAVDHRADIYAVGVLAYEMMTGLLPFEATSDIATIVAAQLRDADPPSTRNAEIPPEVDSLVLRALARSPDARPATMAELAADIARLRVDIARASRIRAALPIARLAAQPRPANPPRARTVALRPAPRAFALGLGGAALLLAAAVAALAYRAAGPRSARAAPVEASQRATSPSAPAAAPRPSAPATPAATLQAAVSAEVLARPPARAAAPAVQAPPPARAAPPRPRARTGPRDADRDGLRDPYAGDGAELKPDPFE
jgi:eukaryotic-like serine/threonine-protein kinase